jgi:putative Mg2+ transporter-C (MgtC) family protein
MADLSLADVTLRLVAGAVLGGVIGIERERDGHEAGIRTHLLVALGSALFGLVSVGAFDSFARPTDQTNFTVDPSRIASYVVAGIGFLGAGVIVKNNGAVHGLTTAASLWIAAAAGLAAGLGALAAALVGTAIATVALVAKNPLHWLAGRLPGRHRHERSSA